MEEGVGGDMPIFKHTFGGFMLRKRSKQWPNIKLTLTCDDCNNRAA